MFANYNIDSFILNTTLEVSSLINKIQINDNFGTLEVNIDREIGMRKHFLRVYVCYHTTYGRRRPIVAYIPILTSRQREQASTKIIQVVASYIAKHAARKMLKAVTPVTAMYEPVIMSREMDLHPLEYFGSYEMGGIVEDDFSIGDIKAIDSTGILSEIRSLPENIIPITAFDCDTYVEL